MGKWDEIALANFPREFTCTWFSEAGYWLIIDLPVVVTWLHGVFPWEAWSGHLRPTISSTKISCEPLKSLKSSLQTYTLRMYDENLLAATFPSVWFWFIYDIANTSILSTLNLLYLKKVTFLLHMCSFHSGSWRLHAIALRHEQQTISLELIT